MHVELMASMMCANYGNLEHEVKELSKGGIDSFHIDIMDGRYVPNFAMSLNDMSYIASATPKPLDVHLMVERPNNIIELFISKLRKGDTVYIHPEAEYHPSTTCLLYTSILSNCRSNREYNVCGNVVLVDEDDMEHAARKIVSMDKSRWRQLNKKAFYDYFHDGIFVERYANCLLYTSRCV